MKEQLARRIERLEAEPAACERRHQARTMTPDEAYAAMCAGGTVSIDPRDGLMDQERYLRMLNGPRSGR